MRPKLLTLDQQPFLIRLMQHDLERAAHDLVKASGWSGTAPTLLIKPLNAFARLQATPPLPPATSALIPQSIRT